ncbi:MAG: hypothetical protein IKY62_00630 [Clostridia bacterium]|nr:hypothetical protein [Clostridia bacterium]
MPLFLFPLLLAIIMLLFLEATVRIKSGDRTVIEIEIQPIRILLTDDKSKHKKKKDKKRSKKDTVQLIKGALPYARVTLTSLDVSVQSDGLFPFYRNLAYLSATAYPIISVLSFYSKSFTVEDGALSITPISLDSENSNFKLDLSFDLRVYAIIFIFIRHLLLAIRRKMNARRNEGNN